MWKEAKKAFAWKDARVCFCHSFAKKNLVQQNLLHTLKNDLGEEKKDALVELTLPKDSNIYAQQYALYLPDKKLLQAKLREWLEEQEE